MRAAKNFRCASHAARLALAAVWLAAAAPLPAQQTPPASSGASVTTAQPAPQLRLPGVENFGEVTPTLLRGAQPDPQGFEELKRLGVGMVVNLRAGKNSRERSEVSSLGMRYVAIPWGALHRPSNQKVAEFLELIRAHPGEKIFVHCREGADRTGVMVAAFRIADQHWSPEQALEEMHAYHFHHTLFHSWQRYIQRLPQQLSTDLSFRSLQSAAASQ